MGNWQTGGLGTFQGASADALFGNRCVSIYLLVLFCLSPSCSKGLRAWLTRHTRRSTAAHVQLGYEFQGTQCAEKPLRRCLTRTPPP